jgi:hypothetical protein
MALPMPRDAPVTKTELPFNEVIPYPSTTISHFEGKIELKPHGQQITG